MSQQSPNGPRRFEQPAAYQDPYQPPAGQYPGYQQGPYSQGPVYPQGPGYPQPPQKPKKSIWRRWWMICLYILVGLIIIGSIGSGGDDTSTSTDSSDAAAPAKKAGIGTAVKSDDLTFSVTGFKCGVSVSDPLEDITPQGQFCKMSVTIKNDGSEQATVNDSQIKVKDAKGNEYSTSSDTLMVDGNIFLKDINPGNQINGVAYYDVPKGTTPVTAEFSGSLFGGAAEVSLS